MNEPTRPEIVRPADDVYAWIEDKSSIHFKAVTRFGDPIKLTVDEARSIAEALIDLARRLERLDQGRG